MATRTIHKTQQPVVLEGFQAVLKPSQYGYKLEAIVDQTVADMLEVERAELVNWCLSKVKNPKRATERIEPWEEVAEGKYKVKFSWGEDNKPPIVDTEGTPVTDITVPVHSGSTVKIGFYQKPYVLKDGITYGTSLKLVGVQLITVKGSAGIDTGDLDVAGVAELFGTTAGYKASEPNVTPKVEDEVAEEEDDF